MLNAGPLLNKNTLVMFVKNVKHATMNYIILSIFKSNLICIEKVMGYVPLFKNIKMIGRLLVCREAAVSIKTQKF